jgi:hypothetical protein
MKKSPVKQNVKVKKGEKTVEKVIVGLEEAGGEIFPPG